MEEDVQVQVNKAVEEDNTIYGFSPAMIEILQKTEQLLKMSEQLCKNTEALRRHLNV